MLRIWLVSGLLAAVSGCGSSLLSGASPAAAYADPFVGVWYSTAMTDKDDKEKTLCFALCRDGRMFSGQDCEQLKHTGTYRKEGEWFSASEGDYRDFKFEVDGDRAKFSSLKKDKPLKNVKFERVGRFGPCDDETSE
jgi:hypothetical protein